MNIFSKSLKNELLILRGRYKKLGLLLFYCALLVYVDYFIITKFDAVLSYISTFKMENLFEIPLHLVALCMAILLRPILSWGGTAYSVYISQRILRDIENDIKIRFLKNRNLYTNEFKSGEISNVYITYGRWFIDSFLLPLIRAILELAIILTITAGLLKQFPFEVLIFSSSLFTILTAYNLLTKPILRSNGKHFVQSSEKLINHCNYIFEEKSSSQIIGAVETDFDQTLDQKMKSGIILGIFSQGLKNVIELGAMFAFGVTIVYVISFSSSSVAVFGSTFVYAIFRILPSIGVLLTFYQQRNNARFAIERLGKIFVN